MGLATAEIAEPVKGKRGLAVRRKTLDTTMDCYSTLRRHQLAGIASELSVPKAGEREFGTR
jgi:hypothetical protein